MGQPLRVRRRPLRGGYGYLTWTATLQRARRPRRRRRHATSRRYAARAATTPASPSAERVRAVGDDPVLLHDVTRATRRRRKPSRGRDLGRQPLCGKRTRTWRASPTGRRHRTRRRRCRSPATARADISPPALAPVAASRPRSAFSRRRPKRRPRFAATAPGSIAGPAADAGSHTHPRAAARCPAGAGGTLRHVARPPHRSALVERWRRADAPSPPASMWADSSRRRLPRQVSWLARE